MTERRETAAPAAPSPQRLDRWLWFARFCKSRSLAARLCEAGRIRLGGAIVTKAHQTVRPGDVLTFPLGPHIRVVRVVDVGRRRGPAAEARTLYEDLAPPEPAAGARVEPGPGAVPPAVARRPRGAGRPTKAERRALERLKCEE